MDLSLKPFHPINMLTGHVTSVMRELWKNLRYYTSDLDVPLIDYGLQRISPIWRIHYPAFGDDA